MKKIKLFIVVVIYLSFPFVIKSQSIEGKITDGENALEMVDVYLKGHNFSCKSDSVGNYSLKKVPFGTYILETSIVGYTKFSKKIKIDSKQNYKIDVNLSGNKIVLKELVVSGTLKQVNRMESLVPVEVYNSKFLNKNPSSCLFDALQTVNGIRPQVNCNICNTGDIRINGLPGPYTMVLIDGMPIVSSLSTVYGLSGIPNAMIDKIEVVKGPASSIYGSEAIGGLINIITKKNSSSPQFSFDSYATSWSELNTDVSAKFNIGNKISILTGVNNFYFNNVVDKNKDGFTDISLQKRISIFQKWNIERKNNKQFSLAARYFNEERWGGQTNWTKEFRGGDSIYGESIYTKRLEIFGNYQIPTKEKLFLSFSLNNHHQDSRYGTSSYIANQSVGFAQLVWDKKINKNDFLVGAAIRNTVYDDNTTATSSEFGGLNNPNKIFLPGIFVQNEYKIDSAQSILAGIRYDYNSVHKNIVTPRLAYKIILKNKSIIRLNSGTGFRAVNLFTEDHAALTGARKVVILENLNPEKSFNTNLNYTKKFSFNNKKELTIDLSAFYTYFNNRIIPDYLTDPNLIIYKNINGYGVSRGLSMNVDFDFNETTDIILGGTFLDVFIKENQQKNQQILTENFSASWTISHKIEKYDLRIDYTGNVFSPMQLPLIGELDPRNEKSPWWSIQNIQFVYLGIKNFEIYGGIKNLFDFLPGKNNPFLIARANDPFDKNIKKDSNGNVIATPDNPYALSFDPTYVFAPNQGRRYFLGLRYSLF
jgi:outer membrane receptor for ferrienterochelin and colicins